MAGHHLILGTLKDFLTGETLEDTHDERYRQKLARILIEEKGFTASDITSNVKLLVKADSKKAVIKVDFVVSRNDRIGRKDRIGMIVKYGPGSLITRHRSSLAMSRLLAPYQIPLVVVTNGEDADILDGITGNVIASGLNGIPNQTEFVGFLEKSEFNPISLKRSEMESRIIYVYEVDGSCPCDDTICRLDEL